MSQGEFILTYLKQHGPSTLEDITSACRDHGPRMYREINSHRVGGQLRNLRAHGHPIVFDSFTKEYELRDSIPEVSR